MEYKQMLKTIEQLPFDKTTVVCENDGVCIHIVRPSKLPKRLKNQYDIKKNFQIWLKEGEREFKPNHLRVFIDLNLRTRSRPDLKGKLLTMADKIFYGEDPSEAAKPLMKEHFEHFLNPLSVTAHLLQLFIIEQAYNYTKESKFEPRTLFFQGWVREFIDSPKEIDNMCMSACSGQPPKTQYTAFENQKNKKFQKNLKPLWYLVE